MPPNRLTAQGNEPPLPDRVLTLDNYRALLADIEEQLQRIPLDGAGSTNNDAPLDGASPRTAAYRAIQEHVAAVQEVTLPSGITIQLRPLLGLPADGGDAADVEPIDVEPIDVETVAAGLARVQLVQAQLVAAVNDNTATRLALLDEVLARAEFNPRPSLWQQIRRWFLDWLEWLLPEPAPGAGAGFAGTLAELLTWGLAIGGALAVALLLSYWLQSILANFVSDAETRRRLDAGEELPLTAAAARVEATKQAQAGNYRGAVRHLYHSMLLALEDKGTIRYDRSLTNREVLAQVKGREAVSEHLKPVVDTFDDVWYGVHEPDQQTFDSYQAEIDQLGEVVDRSKQ